MPAVQTTSAPTARHSLPRDLIRWLVTFLGYPLGGFVAWLVLGPVDSLAPALLGGLVTGAILGAVQAWGLARDGRFFAQWSAATSVGLMAGLGLGATTVDYDTTLSALVIQGAICGFFVGAAQAVVLRPTRGLPVLAWPFFLAVVWAAGWTVTTSAGIGVDEQFTVFGASGALVVALLTLVLPFVLRRSDARTR